MDIQILEKGQIFELEVASKQSGPKSFYFGAGWDNPNDPVDLDIVCVKLRGGRLTKNEDLIYFSNRSQNGVILSEDNRTGEGEGDDEYIIISTDALESDVDSVIVGLAAYQGADFSNAPNPHFRVCDGHEETSPQIADVKVGSGVAGDTVLAAFSLRRTESGWSLEDIAEFYNKGKGTDAIKGFAGLYQ